MEGRRIPLDLVLRKKWVVPKHVYWILLIPRSRIWQDDSPVSTLYLGWLAKHYRLGQHPNF